MGPDEFISHEEFTHTMNLVFATFNLQAAALKALTTALVDRGALTRAQADAASKAVEPLPVTQQVFAARRVLDDFLTMQGIARTYLDPLGENPKG